MECSGGGGGDAGRLLDKRLTGPEATLISKRNCNFETVTQRIGPNIILKGIMGYLIRDPSPPSNDRRIRRGATMA
jgi:hypothetical protein